MPTENKNILQDMFIDFDQLYGKIFLHYVSNKFTVSRYISQ